MSKRKEHKPRMTGSARPHCGWSQEVHQGQSGTPMSILARKRGSTFRCPLDGLCGLRDPVHVPAGLGARPQGQTCAVLAEEECAKLWDFNPGPQQPRPKPCDYYL
ncbi:Uncharacterized protein FKW44_016558 [Caligus rogercresseyi]|uniref:Uncharacterized protein n=1 Tax=Caligus rogercresseyi TaxID=217165 RepID=A0A7T8H1Z1_CALRO|nr:Uncharacterized protein FKW44_016558 [Caligus rogercresseyi]